MNSHHNTYRLGINSIALVEKPDKDFPWPEYMGRFQVEEVTPGELLLRVGKGFGFSPVFGGDGYPTLKNFCECPYIVVDMDTEDERSSYKTLTDHPLTCCHGAMLYPTHSYAKDKPRQRLIFFTDEPMRNPNTLAWAMKAFAEFFGGGDPSVHANKTWQANGKIDADDLWDLTYYPERFHLSKEHVLTYVEQYKALVRRREEKARKGQRKEYKQQTGDDYMTIAELAKRLGKVDSYSMGYDAWVKLGAAIAHCYGQDAYWLFKDWSDKPGKTPVNQSKYNSMLRSHPQGANYGTIVYMLDERNA